MPAPPEHVIWMRQTFPEVRIIPPETTMWRLMREVGFPPTARRRYCCVHFKERYGNGRVVMTGVRWEESRKRSDRRMVESCQIRGSNKTFVHPIIDWTEADVWGYIAERGLAHSPLYDEGFSRVGCVLCPMASAKQKQRDAQRWPKIADQWVRVCDDLVRGMPGCEFTSGQDMFDWYVGLRPGVKQSLTFTCEFCGAEIERKPGGRKPKYCSESCRMKAYRRKGG